MDDPELLTSSSPTRKHSEEEEAMRSSAASILTSDKDVENTVVDSGQQKEDVSGSASAISADTARSDLNPSRPYVVITSASPGQYDPAENVQNCITEPVKWTIGTSQSHNFNSADDEPPEREEFEPYDDKPFDEAVYSGNERPRCEIGIDDYSDSTVGASMDDSAVSSNMSIHELPEDKKLLTRRQHRLSESELTSFCGVAGDKSEQHFITKDREGRRCKSDGDFITWRERGHQETSSVTCIVEEDASKPQNRKGRPKSHSISMVENVNHFKNSQGNE